MKVFVCAVLAMAMSVGAKAQTGVQAGAKTVAQTPPMGWNSWDAFGLTITEPQFRANVDVLKAKLLPYGWQYAVIDEGWFFENPQDRETPDLLHYAIDSHGRYVPVPARFPSAGQGGPAKLQDGMKYKATLEETGFTEIAKYVHAQGLKFGIHIVRGIPRASVERNLPIADSQFHVADAADTNDKCPWDPTNWGVKDNAAGQAWYDSLLKQYAAWGVDLLKVDCIGDHPYQVTEIRMIRKAIDKTGRPMVLSLSPGPMNLSHGDEAATLANMWRISNDEWDLWRHIEPKDDDFPQGVKDQFVRLQAWESYAKPGTWPDADMLPLGELRPLPGWGAPRSSRLTPAEQKTLVTLWSIARSPLIVGANLTMLDDATLKLLTNKEAIALDQKGSGQRQTFQSGDLIGWRSHLPSGQEALALFNTGDADQAVKQKFEDFDSKLGSKSWKVRDVWAGRELGTQTGVDVTIPAHGVLLLQLLR